MSNEFNKMKVLDLQSLMLVSGGTADEYIPSTKSNDCGTVGPNETSGESNKCRTTETKTKFYDSAY